MENNTAGGGGSGEGNDGEDSDPQSESGGRKGKGKEKEKEKKGGSRLEEILGSDEAVKSLVKVILKEMNVAKATKTRSRRTRASRTTTLEQAKKTQQQSMTHAQDLDCKVY